MSSPTFQGLSKHRFESLSDGIYSIAMTLLVLALPIPVAGQALQDLQFRQSMLAMWPRFVTFAMGFVVLAVYWVAQHSQYHFIRRVDRTFLWIGLMFLMCISAMPFSVAALGAHPELPTANMIFAGHVIVAGLIQYFQWHYATRHQRLVDPDFPPALASLVKRKIAISIGSYVVAFLLAPWLPLLSFALEVLTPLNYVLLGGRSDRQFIVAKPGDEPAHEGVAARQYRRLGLKPKP